MIDAEKIAEFKKVILNIKYLLDQAPTDLARQNLRAYIGRISQSDLME